MGCLSTGSVHCLGLACLLLSLALSLAGVCSPYWNERNLNDSNISQGLWSLCVHKYGQGSECNLKLGQDYNTVHWRVIQTFEVLGVAFLIIGLVYGVITCIFKSSLRYARARYTTSAVIATGGLLGYAGNVLYAWYLEYCTTRLPGVHPYSWSFAFSLAGYGSSFAAALIILNSNLCTENRTILTVRLYPEGLFPRPGRIVSYCKIIPTSQISSPGEYYVKRNALWPRQADTFQEGLLVREKQYQNRWSCEWWLEPAINVPCLPTGCEPRAKNQNLQMGRDNRATLVGHAQDDGSNLQAVVTWEFAKPTLHPTPGMCISSRG